MKITIGLLAGFVVGLVLSASAMVEMRRDYATAGVMTTGGKAYRVTPLERAP